MRRRREKLRQSYSIILFLSAFCCLIKDKKALPLSKRLRRTASNATKNESSKTTMSLVALRTTKFVTHKRSEYYRPTCTTARSQHGPKIIKVFQYCAPANGPARKKRCCVLSRYTVNASQRWIFHHC